MISVKSFVCNTGGVEKVVQVFKEIQEQPEKILEMVRADMPQAVGGYLSEIMRLELTKFLGRKPWNSLPGSPSAGKRIFPPL